MLHARLGDASTGSAQGRYVWLREFGNRNYKGTFEQIEIAHFSAGEKRLREITAPGKAIVLLCGCRDVNLCHRKVVAEMLAESWHAEIVHLPTPPKAAMASQSMLFGGQKP